MKESYFSIISSVIVIMGFSEIFYHTVNSNKTKFGLITAFIFIPISYFFIVFSFQENKYLFYSLFVITVFDAFSQLSGQLFGSRKILPTISPNKTYEGFLGGLIMGILTSLMIKDLLGVNALFSIVIGFGVSISAFIGDLTASYVKRQFIIKDYSQLLPGQGGFLDRFDSLILGNIFTLLILNFV
jgi:phosphatidate cytidylyltransferase